MKPPLLALLLASLFLTGCASYVASTDDQRADSFKSFESTTLGGRPMDFFLQSRTAVIVSNVVALAARTDGPTETIYLRTGAGGDYGHAAAIEADGYFITAAHCVGDNFNYLIYYDGHSARIAVPRVVARIFDPPKSADFAILHVDAHLPAVFAWARIGELRAGATAFAVGCTAPTLSGSYQSSYEDTCLAGHLTRMVAFTPPALVIASDLPIRKGDSGGPLVTAAGHLAGIKSRSGLTKGQERIQLSVRPDLAWVERTIWEDQLHHPSAPPAMDLPPYPLSGPFRSLAFRLCGDPSGVPSAAK